MISSNEVQDTSKHRLSKKEFDNLKKELEHQVLKNYPELEQKEIINKKSKEKLSKKGAELKRRTGKTSQRDSVKNRLKTVFNSSEDKQSFFENMTNEKLEVYVRGKNIGVVDTITGRKHRLQTLGMVDEFNRISSIVEKSETIKEKVKERKEEIKEQRKPYKEKIKIKKGASQKNNKGEDHMVEKNTTSQETHENINDKEGNIISETVGKVKEFIKGDLTAEEVLEQRKQEMKGERESKEQTKNESSNTNKR